MTGKSNNKILIVLGMHRSGTSLVSSWLSACGLNLGDRLMGGNKYNLNGHFEDLDFHDIHEEIFKENNIKYGGLQKIDNLHVSEYHQEKIKHITLLKKSLRDQWGWKEPRTNIFLDFYRDFLPEANYLVLYRKPEIVVDSLLRRETAELLRRLKKIDKIKFLYYTRIAKESLYKKVSYKNKENYTECWKQHNQKIIKHLEQINPNNYKIVDIDALCKNSDSVLDWLNKKGFELKSIDFNDVFDSKQLNRTTKTIEIPISEYDYIDDFFNKALNGEK